MSGSNSNSVICEEVFFDGYQPSTDEIKDYALKIGIDPAKEPHLLYLAREGLLQALPPDWKICYNDQLHAHYYYNVKTKITQWEHPLDDYYKELVEQARQKLATTPTSGSTIDISEDASQLDSGIRSLQLNEELELHNSNFNLNNDTTNNTTITTSSSSSSASASSIHSGSSSSNNSSHQQKMNALGSANQKFLETKISSNPFHHSHSSPSIGLNLKPLKTSRFEVVKTNPQISLDMKMNTSNSGVIISGINNVNTNLDQSDGITNTGINNDSSEPERKGFQISGMGAMFLKSNSRIKTSYDIRSSPSNSSINGNNSSNGIVKGILRDGDIRRRLKEEENSSNDIHLQLIGLSNTSNNSSTDDKKSVRFNLDDIKMRSPEDEQSSSRKFTHSPEVSDNSEEDGNDPWDFNEEDDNFIEEKHVKEVKVTPIKDNVTNSVSGTINIQPQTIKLTKPLMKSSSVDSSNNSISIGNTIFKSNLGDKTNPSVLEKLKGKNLVKPLYEDTDSDSKGSSILSFVKHDEYSDLLKKDTIELEDLSREHNENLEKLKKKLKEELEEEKEKLQDEMRLTLEKMKNDYLKDNEKKFTEFKNTSKNNNEESLDSKIAINQKLLKEENDRLEKSLNDEILELKRQHNEKLKQIETEYDNQLVAVKQQFEEENNRKLEEYRLSLEKQFEPKRNDILHEHKVAVDILQKNHAEMLQELERDLKSEEEILKKEHITKLNDMREKLSREMELERQRMRESGEDRLYEKIRCEKRLLEDKYRCLKDKYGRLKSDVKLSLERRNRRREQLAAQQQQQQQNLTNTTNTTTGSETERSLSNKPSIGNSELKSPSISTSYPEQSSAVAINPLSSKPPTVVITSKHSSSLHPSRDSDRDGNHIRERSTERQARKMGIASKYIKHLQVHYQDDTTSISQSDTTISNNYTRGKYLPAPYSSDNGNSDSEAFIGNQENNNNSTGAGATATATAASIPPSGKDRQRKKQFSRTKSASTSRLNTENYKSDRPCTPVENLRRQLQKLEDLEDQFPDNTLDATYHLRYPFSDISNDHAGTSSELEFFKHRIHLERDSVRRAKESLRTQRTNFRARQREIKQRHKQTNTRHSLDQLIQEEKELTEMEVNLHRTRALLGEKVIRLRHLEQSLQRIYEKDKQTNMDLLHVENKEDATLSDLSSHSSSGFSSTDFASDTNALLNRRKEIYQDSSEAIKNLEILNIEIREILDIIGKQQIHGATYNPPEFDWSTALYSTTPNNAQPIINTPTAGANNPAIHHNLFQTPPSIPTLSDRLETYRQLAAGRVQSSMGTAMMAANTIVSQNPRAVNYTTSLVERTRDLRNWLRQQWYR
ncbi:putative uncharacterized protein DDB_G0282133 isoform X2 [Condylostylus longicornis]|uniref:putative uncharacterized protein DDB_G0282133 isoform X2 n=1 Tax=Condylostylus longicornis TaxID=2530218 RepID=UPI00244DF14E|nr:putative uncharacterized protein DDB_G0282133 isoform X2 [Condylostylus longicornis]